LLSRLPLLGNLRDKVPGLAGMLESMTGFSRERRLPTWRRDVFRQPTSIGPEDGRPVILFADTFNTYFEPENLRAASRVLVAAGYRVVSPRAGTDPARPLCCGRTFLTSGLVDQATREISRLIDCLYPLAREGVPIIGLEPSCLLSLRDELPGLLPGEKTEKIAGAAVLFEEFIAAQQPDLKLKTLQSEVLLHGHCHQKAFNVMGSVEQTLNMVPGLTVERIESGCCGMAGAFGYGVDTIGYSRQMAELDLLPRLRQSSGDTFIVADGISCRQQIEDGAGLQAMHAVRVLDKSLQ
jgi:Fe-S oxidoreductase